VPNLQVWHVTTFGDEVPEEPDEAEEEASGDDFFDAM
jgi:hypothetical protein